MLNERLFLSFRHVTYSLRGGFLVRPLIIALALGCAGALLSALEETIPGLSTWAPKVLFPSHADPQVAQVVLAAIAASMMTVVSIVFAILLMTLTLASMQFSPRIIVSFARDRVTQQTLGIFLGTFSYCVAALPAARSVPQPFAPVLTVLGAMLLALACVAWLLFFIHHISQAISVNHIVEKIATETEAIIDDIMPEPRRHRRMPEAGPPEPSEREGAVSSDVSGYVRFIDIGRLVFLAKSYGVIVRIVRRVGHFVPAGIPLLMVSKVERLSPGRSAELRGAFDLGPTRTLQQDIEFGILQIVDIALRAISPAVNDPSTAINCVDQLSRILIRFASREEAASLRYDPPGVLRVSIPWPGFDRLVDAAFDQIRLYAKADVAVSLRMLRALADIATTIPDPAVQQTLAERGRQIVAGCTEALAEEELGKLHLRLSALEKLAISPEAPLNVRST
ncbi:MAG TPA: DUF2254 domain-containing protein [Candidatus Methylomirabilis sp.]|nr:DUF2254 domain-containing protein [Candidatus Methylomirabilis sp.]